MVGNPSRILLGLLLGAATASAARAADGPAAAAPSRTDRATLYALPGEEPTPVFVPNHPRSVEDQREIEAVRDYSVARALEERRAWNESIGMLEAALKLEPDSIAILRRLSRLCFMIGRTDAALGYSRRVLDADPGDTDTISRLVTHFARKNDPTGAETLLKDVLANPKLDRHAPGRLLAEYELGKLYAGKLQRPDKAADCFERVVAELDEKASNRLSPIDHQRILGGDESEAYLEFGNVFENAKRRDLAIKAFRRGLVYNEDHPVLPLRLAETLLETDNGTEALAVVERFLKRQPQGSEGYELLARVLTALKRGGEITPRLEQAARADSKNLPLQYALADRYREIGQNDKAEALYKTLLAAQPTPQGYGALAASLLKRKKTEELLRTLTEALNKPGGFEAVKPQLEAIIKDPDYADEVLDAGLKLLKAEPPALDRAGTNLLSAIATETGKADPKKLEKLVAIQRFVLKQNPGPIPYRELLNTQVLLKRYADAASTIEELMAKFPDERNARLLITLSQIERDAGKLDAALATAREAQKLEPNDSQVQVILCILLSQVGKADESIDVARNALKLDPTNAIFNRLLGTVLAQFGRDNEAIALYKGLLDRYPNNDEIVRLARAGLSVVYTNQGDFEKGAAELELLLERDPDEPGVNNDLGYLWADQGKNLERAESMVRKALQDDPKNSAYLDSLGWVLFKRGKVKEAVAPLEEAIQSLNPNGTGDATIYEHLGDVFFRLQEHAKAREAWEKAEKNGARAIPPDRRLAEIRKKLKMLNELKPAPKPASSDTP